MKDIFANRVDILYVEATNIFSPFEKYLDSSDCKYFQIKPEIVICENIKLQNVIFLSLPVSELFVLKINLKEEEN